VFAFRSVRFIFDSFVRERSEKAKNEGYYFKSHGLQALAIESAGPGLRKIPHLIPHIPRGDAGNLFVAQNLAVTRDAID
jgi:hypothetical protein